MAHYDGQGDTVQRLIAAMKMIDRAALEAVTRLAEIGEVAFEDVIQLVGDGDIHQRVNAISVLEQLCDTRAVPALLNLQTHPHMWVRMSSAKALGALRCSQSVEGLIRWLAYEEDVMVVMWIVLSLGKLEDQAATEPLVHSLQQTDSPTLRYTILRALGELGDPRAIPAIRAYLADPDRHVALDAKRALAKLEGHSAEGQS